MKNYILAFLLFTIPFICISQNILPAYNTANWSDLKTLDIPVLTDSVQVSILDFGGDATGATSNNNALSNAIVYLKSTNKTGIVLFPAGIYTFNSTVVLTDNIILKGVGASSTTLRFVMGGAGNLITASGSFGTATTTIIGNGIKNQYKLEVADVSQFIVGDMVKLLETDTDLMYSSWAYQNVGQVMKIKSIVGDSIEFYSAMRLHYPAARNPYLIKLNTIKNVGISCLKIVRGDSVADGNQYSNITFETSSDCWINGVQSDSTFFAHVALSNSYHTVIKGSYFTNSYDYGDNGRGYGIACQYSSSENLIENNIFRHLRHAMLLQSGANGNVFAYNYSRETFWTQPSFPSDVSGDIVCHGNYPFSNLFEGNIVQNMEVDNSHGNNGPYNLFFRNRAENIGVFMNDGAGDSTAFIGNEVTTTAAQAAMYNGQVYGEYTLTGNGNFTYGNNIRGNNLPSGTNNLADVSYYLSNKPAFLADPWPSIGYPNAINTGTNTAKTNYDAGTFIVCNSQPNSTVLALQQIFLYGQASLNNTNTLSWAATANNENVSYKILRSGDGVYFDTIYALTAKPILANANYQYVDTIGVENQQVGTLYYRVLGFQNGKVAFESNVVTIKNGTGDALPNVTIYPNPASAEVSAIFYKKWKNLTASLIDQHGRLMSIIQNISTVNGWNKLKFSVGVYPAGIYYLVIHVDGATKSCPIIKN